MFQFHGVVRRRLRPAIQDINCALLDTLAAYGDVNGLVSLIQSLWQIAYLNLLPGV